MCNSRSARNYLVVQWLGLCAFTAKGLGLIPGWGTKIPQAMQLSQKKKKQQQKTAAYMEHLKCLLTQRLGATLGSVLVAAPIR